MTEQLRHFELTLEVPLRASEAWERVLDLRGHDRFIPFTRITQGLATAGELHPGHLFTARTMVGPVGFDDVMTVESISPPTASAPGRARIVKGGPLVLGARPAGRDAFELSYAVGSRPFEGFAELELSPTRADPLVSFDPVENGIPGLEQYGWVTRLREPASALARRSRR